MKKKWEEPLLETIGLNMTEQGPNLKDGNDGLWLDSKGALLLGGVSGQGDDQTNGFVNGPFTYVGPYNP